MKITVYKNLSASANFSLLGYMGETKARTICVSYPQIEGADTYRLRFKYADNVAYETVLTNSKYIVDGSILRLAGNVEVQWIATKSEGDFYNLVAKSSVITLRIEQGISDQLAPIPTYEQSILALDELLNYTPSFDNVDSTLSSTSVNPVQNKVVNSTINNLTSYVNTQDSALSSRITTAQTTANTANTNISSVSTRVTAIENNVADLVSGESTVSLSSASSLATISLSAATLGFTPTENTQIIALPKAIATPSTSLNYGVTAAFYYGQIHLTITPPSGTLPAGTYHVDWLVTKK